MRDLMILFFEMVYSVLVTHQDLAFSLLYVNLLKV